MTTSKKTGTSWTNNPTFDRATLLLASGFGLGSLPFLPGTMGSLLGLALAWATSDLSAWLQLVLLILSTLIAIGAAERAEQVSRSHDPDFIVIDEVVGMWITMLFLWRFDATAMILGFLLFRLFDVVKFFPLNLFEGFRGGLGIVMDDLAAGMLANVFLRLLLLSGIALAGIG